MNPNLAQTLDPKLKEAYDRVMGAEINPQPVGPKPAQPAAPQAPASQAEPPVQEPQAEMVDINAPSQVSEPQAQSAVKKSKIKPVIFIAAGVVFFALYTFIWLKFFSVI